jgi:hypothetical protein
MRKSGARRRPRSRSRTGPGRRPYIGPVFDPNRPLTIESVNERGHGQWVFSVSSEGAHADLTFVVENVEGMPFRVFNPDEETRQLLGHQLDALAGRTFAAPILRRLREGEPLNLPVHLPCWWQGPDTPGWQDW